MYISRTCSCEDILQVRLQRLVLIAWITNLTSSVKCIQHNHSSYSQKRTHCLLFQTIWTQSLISSLSHPSLSFIHTIGSKQILNSVSHMVVSCHLVILSTIVTSFLLPYAFMMADLTMPGWHIKKHWCFNGIAYLG